MNTLPDLISLQCFITLSQHLNFRTAAYEMCMSTSAMSDRIKKLEQEIGLTLFERSTRHVHLSEDGFRLLPHAQHLIEQAWQWNEAVRAQGASIPYQLRVGTRFELGMSWLVPAIPTLQEWVAERRFEFYWSNDQDLLNKLQQGYLDVVISSVRMNHHGLRSIALHQEDYVFVCSPTYYQQHKDHINAKHASLLTLIDTENHLPLFRYFLDALESQKVWDFKHIECMGTIAAVRARVLADAGVAVLPHYFIHKDIACKHLIQIEPHIKLSHDFFRLIWRNDHALTSTLELFAQHLQTLELT